MFGGVEFGLLPAVPTTVRAPQKPKKRPGAWLSGALILRCERQGLSSLPEQLWHKTTVQQLILTDNALFELPPQIHLLQQLRVLKLAHNQLQQLPGEVCLLTNLQHLDVRHNQLQIVPANLCKLVNLERLQLEGNPMGGRFTAQGPTLQELWQSYTSNSSSSSATIRPADGRQYVVQSSGEQQQNQQQLTVVTSISSAACKAATQQLLEYLVGLVNPEEALALKQAKLQRLQHDVAQQVVQMSRRADSAALQACLAMAEQVGLPEEQLDHVRQAQQAVSELEAALQEEDHQRLGTAIRAFEALCRPGRPEGEMYSDAHARWRQLQRAAVAKGWKCTTAELAAADMQTSGSYSHGIDASTHRSGTLQDAGSSGQLQAEGSRRSDVSAGAASRHWMTMQELRKQQLLESGAPKYEDWVRRKKEAAAREQAQLASAVAREQRKRAEELRQRAEQALEFCEKERSWPSTLAEAYPRGTFSLDGQKLRTVRQAYGSPQATARSATASG